MKLFIAMLVLLIFSSCNTKFFEDPEDIAEEVFPTIDLWLTITDSIGVEYGDSNLVFAMPNHALQISRNRIVVMDLLKARISVFDTSGNYISSIGRQGSGPGEFLQPSWFSLTPSGGIVVSDAITRSLIFFDSNFVYRSSMGPFFPSSPDRIIFLNDSVFVGSKPDYEMNGQEISAGFVVSMWSLNALEPIRIFYRDLAHFDPANPFSSEAIQPIFTMSQNGIVYTSAKSIDEYSIQAWDLDGSLLFTITEPYTPISKAQEVVDQEIEVTYSIMRLAGIPDSILDSMVPDPFYFAIANLGIGPSGNLWVTLGNYNHPIFRVYDSNNGEYLFSAALEYPESMRNLSITVNQWGFTAVDPMSGSWPRVYILTPR
ncbi:MAG: 6-bladed beta-propeller [Candidatus Sabulitectum sp.]|nr:6-bladed beta-propeller [Candidatus Sabulitectum sp.]